MKNITKKISAFAIAAALAVSTAGCTIGSGKWSYKTKVSEISAGSWIYRTYESYQEALSKIQEANEGNSDFDIQLIDITKEKIEDKNAVDWIFDDAKDKCLSLLNIEALAKSNDVVIDETQIQTTGDMYIQYYYSGSEEATAFYEKLGVSKESFAECNTRYNYIYQDLFKKLYGKDGKKEVSDEDVKKYYKENYISYYYIPYSLKTTDEDNNIVDIDGETKEKAIANFNKYRNMINNDKKTTDDIEEAYKTDFEVESVPSSKNTVLTKNFDEDENISDELRKAIKDNKEKQATVTTIDDKLYLIYRDSISELSEKIKYSDDAGEDETDYISKDNIIYTMKKEEYDKFLDEQKKDFKYETNDEAIKKYSIERTVKIAKQG